MVNNSKDQAGYWGDYRNCDLPWHSVENALEQVLQHAKKDGIKLVYFTGDIIGIKEKPQAIQMNHFCHIFRSCYLENNPEGQHEDNGQGL